jgi:hypothetical protein
MPRLITTNDSMGASQPAIYVISSEHHQRNHRPGSEARDTETIGGAETAGPRTDPGARAPRIIYLGRAQNSGPNVGTSSSDVSPHAMYLIQM